MDVASERGARSHTSDDPGYQSATAQFQSFRGFVTPSFLPNDGTGRVLPHCADPRPSDGRSRDDRGMSPHHRSEPTAPSLDAWRITAVISAVIGCGCLVLLVPTISSALQPAHGLGAGGLLALPAIPAAPLCAVTALAVGVASIAHRDPVGISFSAAGLLSASLATTIVALLGGYGFVAWLWEAAVVTEVPDVLRRSAR